MALTYPDGTSVAETYDAAGRLLTVVHPATGTQYLQSATYWADGSPQATTLGNGVEQNITRNARLQVSSMTLSGALSPFNGQQFLAHTYCYSTADCPNAGTANNGNIWGIANGLKPSGSGQSFTYDTSNRVSSFSLDGALKEQYTIDSFGNLSGLSQGAALLTFNANNQIINLPCASYLPAGVPAYDAAGNQNCNSNAGGYLQFGYDAESRITNVVDLLSGQAAPFETYTYGADGSRARKDHPGDASYTEYVSFGGQPLAEKDQTGAWTDYIYANGQKIAQVKSSRPAIQLHGTQTQGAYGVCGTPWYVTGQASSSLPFTIQAGDMLQYDQKAVSAISGVWLGIGPGTYGSGTYTADLTDPSPDGNWHNYSTDLSAFAGQQATSLVMGPGDPNTPVGPYDVWVANLSVVSKDGTVRALFTQGSAAGSVWGTCGNTDLSLQAEQTPMDPRMGTHFFFGDHLGTAQMEFTAGGWPVYQGTFALFGGEMQLNGSPLDPTQPDGSSSQYKFTGKERDTELGNDYFGARYYASSVGRFSSPDPGWFFATRPDDPQSWNLYAYARNNPLSFVDPDGYDCVYLNNAGTDVDRDQNGNPTGIDQNSNSGECGNNGGYWVDGTVTQVNLYTNSNDVGLSGMWETGANAGQQMDSYYTNASSNGPGGVDLLSLPDSSFGEYRPLQNVLYSRQLDPWQAPSRLFGSHWCGPGGGGIPVSNLDAACKAHDQCFDAAGISAANNVGGGSMTLQQAAAAQGCNAALAAAAAANPNDPGSSRVSAWLKHGDQLLVITGGRIDGKLAAGTAVR